MSLSARHIALQEILAIVTEKEHMDAVFEARKDRSLSDKDHAFVSTLVYGTLRWWHRLDAWIHQLLKKPLKPKDQDVHCLLVMSAYQLLYLDVPDYAAVSEAVTLVETLKKPWAKGMVNATLRNVSRQKDTLTDKLDHNPALKHACPAWLFERIQTDWPEHCESILEAQNAPPPLTLNILPHALSREDWLEKINATPCVFSPTGVSLNTPCDITTLPGFSEGHFIVQDEAAQLAAPLLDLSPGLDMLDACAAPGGKTIHLLSLEPQLNSLVAIDCQEDRLARLEENLGRTQLKCTWRCADLRDATTLSKQSFDRMLLDAPCSGTGVIRRHLDIKHTRTPEAIDRIQTVQIALLQTLWEALRPGGILLYVTCSLLKQENDGTIAAFLKNTPQALIDPIEASWGLPTEFGRQTLPVKQGHDGFYFARLRKPHA